MATVLRVDVGVKVPHNEAGVQDQLTPRLFGSPVTVAARLVLLSMSTEVGGVEVKLTLTLDVMVIVVAIFLLLSDDKVAVIVTVLPVGTVVGAV